MTRAELLARTRTAGLYGALVDMGVDIRPLVCTPEDPWALQSQREVEGWIDRHMLWDDDGELVRVTLQMR